MFVSFPFIFDKVDSILINKINENNQLKRFVFFALELVRLFLRIYQLVRFMNFKCTDLKRVDCCIRLSLEMNLYKLQ